MKFKYGTYEFDINPSSYNKTVKYVGDDPISLSGRVISQPSYNKIEATVDKIFWQPRDKFVEVCSITDVICYNSGNYIGINSALNKFNIYNTNLVYLNYFDISTSLTSIGGITSYGNFIYLNATSAGHNYFYKYNKTTGALVSNLLYTGSSVRGMCNNGNSILYLNDDKSIYSLDYDTGISTLIMTIGTVNDIRGLEYYNGFYYISIDMTTYKLLNTIVGSSIINGVDLGDINEIKSLCLFNDNKLYVCDNTVREYYINSVFNDIYNLEQEVKTGKVKLIDHYGREQYYVVSNLSVSRIKKYQKACQVSFKLEGKL